MPDSSNFLVVRHKTCVFTAPQSLVFLLGTSIVTTTARGARTIAGAEPASVLPLLAAALVVGAIIAVLSLFDAECRPRTRGEWATLVTVAAVNSLVLFVAALGVEKF
jgi:hypothetical protein